MFDGRWLEGLSLESPDYLLAVSSTRGKSDDLYTDIMHELDKKPKLRPIAPRPSDQREALRKRLRAMDLDKEQSESASRMLESADSFILNHMEDALKELEEGKKNKFGLLLEIYASIHSVMAPANSSASRMVTALR